MKTYPAVGVQSPKILIPADQIEYEKWAVVACDQFTSQPEYWNTVEKNVGDAPSSYNLILPEAYLGTQLEQHHASQINGKMKSYLETGIFQEIDGLIYVERHFEGSIRKGLIIALDLEQYDFSSTSHSLIRATEGTIVDRLPPRIIIRKEALIEIPHILVLIDDPEMTVIDPIADLTEGLEPLYDFDLMQNSGQIKGFHIVSPSLEEKILQALENLKSQELQSNKYFTPIDTSPLLFAVGDGNHSLATAKAIWENNKHHLPDDHPSRYALVEVVNLHDESIKFEPIHRLLERKKDDWLLRIKTYFGDKLILNKTSDFPSLIKEVIENQSSSQTFGLFDENGFWVGKIKNPNHTLTIGSVQNCLDDLISHDHIKEVDYIHGSEAILELGTAKGNAGIYLPALKKESFFQSVIKDGALPRKTFSMGEAYQKRFYLECRKIK
ncbi:MAG: DUF1015 domain-containing protein [Pelolinea sp.]|nr:DUF1015 domain-containing protein [Pelolinea sp.]